MNPTVLVLGPNAAVQAIISAALKQAGIDVETLTDGAGVLEKIKRLEPFAVLVSSEVPNSDAFALCRAMKKDKRLSWISLILLAPGSDKSLYHAEAKRAGFDAVLSKPFKSDQVRELIEAELSKSTPPKQPATKKVDAVAERAPEPIEAPLAVYVSESFIGECFRLLLQKFSVSTQLFDSADELVRAAAIAEFASTVVDAPIARDLSWYEPSRMGRLLFVESIYSSETKLPSDSIRLARPLSIEAIVSALEASVILSSHVPRADSEPLDQGQRVLLSAHISSSIYEKLLTMESLQHRKWEEACSTLAAEALKICRAFRE